MTNDLSIALTESATLRTQQINRYSNDEALDSLCRAKALVMAVWRGEKVATTEQIAEYFEVSIETIQTIAKRNRVELESDGMQTLSSKALKGVMFKLNISDNTPRLKLWTPRSALRAGMLLRDSEVAREVRNVVLDIVEAVPAQSDRIKALELELQLRQTEQKLLDTRHIIVTTCPEPIQQKILGYQIVDRVEYRDRIIHNDDVIRDGSTINKTALCKRYNLLTKGGSPNYKQLNQLLDKMPPRAFTLMATLMENQELNRDFLPDLDIVFKTNTRQINLGESLFDSAA